MSSRPDRHRSLLPAFLGSFALIYGFHIVPWPGLDEIYGRYYRALGRVAFAREGERRILRFAPNFKGSRHALDTQITVANRDQLDRHGTGPAVFLTVASRGVGWGPTALTAALILATPVSWRRRDWALLRGMILVHGYILFFLGICILTIPTIQPGWGS